MMTESRTQASELSPRQAEIVSTAIDLISELGIQQLTMRRIAGKLGVSEPALYRHFASKTDVLLALLQTFRDHARAVLEEVQALDAPAPEKIRGMFSRFIDHFIAHPTVTAVIFAEEVFQDDPRLSEQVQLLMSTNQKVLQQLISEGQKRGELRSDVPAKFLTLIVMGGFRLTVARWRLSGRAFDLKAEVVGLWKSLEKMIGTP